MDTSTLSGIFTLLAMLAFLGVCVWAYSRKRKKAFKDAASLPFADEDKHRETLKSLESKSKPGDQP